MNNGACVRSSANLAFNPLPFVLIKSRVQGVGCKTACFSAQRGKSLCRQSLRRK